MDRSVAAVIGKLLKERWGFDAFLPLQREAIEAILARRDSLTVLPTGGGKSLCYQLPAIAMPGVGVVVSPLISLMKDQVDALRGMGVAAAALNSALSPGERRDVYDALRDRTLDLLYVSPERLMMDGFVGLMREVDVAFFAVDEAHCISQWGHDFRPEYRELAVLNTAFPDAGIHAFTATATPRVRDDIVEQLHLDDPRVLVGSFDRPNLVYRVERRDNRNVQVAAALAVHAGESAIVYCIRRADVDELCAWLRGRGVRAVPYHAGLADAQRRRSQDDFIRDRADVVVATVAFGMGIDKSNVRCVIHAGMPKSLEHYQQETGRAGRDGLEAECRLLFSGGDYGVWKSILAETEADTRQLSAMFGYCTGGRCRHRALSEYFGQTLTPGNCGACDVCLGELALVADAPSLAKTILGCVARLRERFGAAHVAGVLTGSTDKKVKQWRHHELEEYGRLSNESKNVVRDWVEQLVEQGFLERRGEYQTLAITGRGAAVLRGEAEPRLVKAEQKPSKPAPAGDSLFDRLRALRASIARERHVPAYLVFSDKTLLDMAARRPSTEAEFRLVHGVGEKKCAEFAEVFIREINRA